jgi:hypothetical protein
MGKLISEDDFVLYVCDFGMISGADSENVSRESCDLKKIISKSSLLISINFSSGSNSA